MLFKVFYQETKKRSPKRETTHSLYLELPVSDVRDGVIQAREIMRDNTEYHVEFIDAISDEQAEYERESEHFNITTF
ncbi:MAG: DNA-dependent RNA polymerase auxiliary subunit epsilon family protein [Lactococcus plantarum]|nr:DNA-dependent RNA polymerase auxiliary subunit epsilon family protein [Lactococcus plantarum]MDN6083851.1 DNA-dependent RNA polymerase auxiliary subunit epsilon family protein [Lactococcus plantarum]